MKFNIDMEKALQIGFPFIKALLILLIGHFVIVYIKKIVKHPLKKKNVDESFADFLLKTISTVLHTVVVLSALSTIGISTSGLIAALSAAVVAIGVALKDSLGNVAGGILLLISPRFATGDFIEANDDSGTVLKVDLLHTTIRTADNKQVSIPNGVLINSHITNYSTEDKRRVDIEFPIPYSADVEKAKSIIMDEIKKHECIINEPEKPLVRVLSYGDSAVNIVVRSWTKTEDYWTVYFDLTESVRKALESNAISMPFNRLDVSIIKEQ